ncbi:uncharacterized mitochondrial protein-like protein [Tanacetum coccineum]
MPSLKDYSIFDSLINDEDDSAEADMNNLDITIQVSPIPTTRIHKNHPLDQVIGDLQSATQTRNMLKNLEEHRFVSTIQQRTNHKDLQNCLFACFLSQEEPKKVYVCQPLGFEDPDFPDRVYKVEKALYRLHQAPRAWYETLSTYLLNNEFQRGKIDKTLFIKRHKGDILLVQVYVDDIIFGLTKKELCNAFEELMHAKFQMSSIGEVTFFLGLQVQQKKDGIFISQDKYVVEILKKFGFIEVKTASTPMETQKPLLKDEDGEEVDVHMYRSMIGLLMYLTSSRPDIKFAVCACARYQVNPKVSHLHAVKRIFRYLKGQPKLGLWYTKDTPLNLVEYIDSDYVGASLDRKSTIGGKAKKSVRLMMDKLIGMEFELMLNMVAFLSKPAESEGFEKIVDFLNAHPIRLPSTSMDFCFVSFQKFHQWILKFLCLYMVIFSPGSLMLFCLWNNCSLDAALDLAYVSMFFWGFVTTETCIPCNSLVLCESSQILIRGWNVSIPHPLSRMGEIHLRRRSVSCDDASSRSLHLGIHLFRLGTSVAAVDDVRRFSFSVLSSLPIEIHHLSFSLGLGRGEESQFCYKELVRRRLLEILAWGPLLPIGVPAGDVGLVGILLTRAREVKTDLFLAQCTNAEKP